MKKTYVSLAISVLLALTVSACTTPVTKTNPEPPPLQTDSGVTLTQFDESLCGLFLRKSAVYFQCSVLKAGGLLEGSESLVLTKKAKLLGDDLVSAAIATVNGYDDPLVATIYRTTGGSPWLPATLSVESQQVF
jgi:hypothetical protein